jgi:hypothetical protein
MLLALVPACGAPAPAPVPVAESAPRVAEEPGAVQPRPHLPSMDEALLVGDRVRAKYLAAAAPPTDPVPWPANTPREQTAEGFWRALTALFDTCDLDALEPIALECAEPPCIAVLRDHGTRASDSAAVRGVRRSDGGPLAACDGFAAAFPGGVDLLHADFGCGDVLVVAPKWTLAPSDTTILLHSVGRVEVFSLEPWDCPPPNPHSTPPEGG